MSEPYEEIIEGESYLRFPPGPRHETICARLHARVAAGLAPGSPARLLAPRSVVPLAPGTVLRPDLALVTAATGKAWLIAEVIDSDDHRTDTVLKKTVYEECHLPRLWMIDPRYNNVEIYHGSLHGLSLKKILISREFLTETLLPQFQFEVGELFRREEAKES